MLDRLLARSEPQGIGVETESLDGGGREQREAVARAPRRRAAPFSSRWTTMTSDPASSSRPAMRLRTKAPWWTNTLRSSFGRQPARVAVAARRLVDAPQPTPEGEVGRLDRVEQQRPVGASVLDEQERGIALELGQSERRLQPADDRLEEVAGDGRRVLDLAPRQVRGVAGQVGDDQEAGLGCRCHAREP